MSTYQIVYALFQKKLMKQSCTHHYKYTSLQVHIITSTHAKYRLTHNVDFNTLHIPTNTQKRGIKMRKDIQIDSLQKLLTYDPNTGLFTWLQREKGRPIGEFAGTAVHRVVRNRQAYAVDINGERKRDPDGNYYLENIPDLYIPLGYVLRIDGRTYPAHTLAHALQTGKWARVSHLNGNKYDNRWSNLTTDRDKSLLFKIKNVGMQEQQSQAAIRQQQAKQEGDAIKRKDLTDAVLRLYKYNPTEGTFMRIHDTYENWTKGTPVKGNGSRTLSFRDKITGAKSNCPCHIAAYILQTGAFPEGKVKHRNEDKSDNRWENLYVK
jgi:hypothetical protein